MFSYFLDHINFYTNYYLVNSSWELYKLISVVDLQKFYIYTTLNQNPNQILFIFEIKKWLENVIISFSNINKFFLFINLFLVKLFFIRVTPITFWVIPSFLMLISAIFTLFFVKPNWLNMHIWFATKYLLFFIMCYQFLLVYNYFVFYNLGFILKVGLAGVYTLPFNLDFAKLISLFLIILILFFTVIFYLDFYTKNLLLIKPELTSILFFLGFGSGMVFLQNDLFSIFLYFEIISFCIYGLLFFQKWTNAQLHSLVRYVLFSLWISTSYIIGIAFYLAGYNNSTSLVNLKTFSTSTSKLNLSNFEFDFLMMYDFELILAITFLLIYFLFKLGVGPFYTWTIEVYNSCTTSSLLSISLIPKLIYFPMLFFLLFYNFIEFYTYWSNLLLGLGLITIFIGCFGILITDKLKEIYAWSSIIHTGNLLVIISCISSVSLTFLIFYLISYILISVGYIVLITSLWNNLTGRFIKTVAELNSLHYLNANFYFSAIILLASAAGFTPFLSFFMKFSLLAIISSHYGVLITILIGLLNIIGSVAYLWMLRNIISFNVEPFDNRFKDQTITTVELKMSYITALLFNFICIFIIFSFFFYKDFINLFAFFDKPFYMRDINFVCII